MSLRQLVLSLATLPLKFGFFAAWLTLFVLWERVRPAAAKPKGLTLKPAARIGGKVTLGVINALLWMSVTLPITVIAIGQATERGFFDWRGPWAAGWAGLIVDIVILDFVAYFLHRSSHEVPFLWRFHEVHHRDEFLDVTTGLRFHFGEIVFGSIFRAMIVCGGAMPLEHVIVFDMLIMAMNWFSHSNIKLPVVFHRALSHVIATPWYHWVHHKATQPKSEQNYAVIFVFWDKIFGTRAERGRRIGSLLGVRHQNDVPLGQLLVLPFQKRE